MNFRKARWILYCHKGVTTSSSQEREDPKDRLQGIIKREISVRGSPPPTLHVRGALS